MTNQVRNTEAGDQRETMLEMMILEVRVNDDSKVQDKVGWKTRTLDESDQWTVFLGTEVTRYSDKHIVFANSPRYI